jgi:ubiquinone biosynthesis protein
VTAKPILERWMNEQIGWRGFIDRLGQEAGQWAQLLPAVPRLAHRALVQAAESSAAPDWRPLVQELVREQRRTRRALWAGALIAGLALVLHYTLG